MKILANITKVLAALSIVSAMGYLYVGLVAQSLQPDQVVLINGIGQILLASFLFFASLQVTKRAKNGALLFVLGWSVFIGFGIYVFQQ